MAVPQGPLLLLLVSSLLLCSSSSRACPQFCTCQRAPLLNCSSAGFSSVPQHIQDSVTELDVSHNLLKSVTLHQPHHNLRSVWLRNNSITHLSLCIGRNFDGHLRGTYHSRPWNRRRCVSWAPTLQLLSVERNQLEQLPEGLEGVESLQVLQLSFNRISTLRPGDLSHLQQLKELHLQHNLITSLHPQMFQDLAQLKVLDLSFNMLTSLHPLMYLTLHNIGTDVRLLGNRWQCDCRMHSLRRRMAFDRSRGLQVWSIMCASPSVLSGRDLLQLQDDDLNCLSTANIPEILQDVTVYSGSEILLSCTAKDSMWWTPSGQASVNQPQGGLLISGITERDTGLYVCVSEEKQVVSVFNLQISEIGGARRKPRSLSGTSQHIVQQGPSNRIGKEINSTVTQSDLALAVCLSVFITFLIAFILGVLARPCIDVLWKKVTKKKNPRETNSVVSVEQRQYDNEAFSTGEELEEIGYHRERRVTFSTIDYREDGNVQYYDTVASGDQESINNDVVIECEATSAKNIKHTAEDSGSESSSHQSSSEDKWNDRRDHSSAGHRHNMEFEPIPDPVDLEQRISLSSLSSDSSLSEKELKEDHTTPKSPQLIVDPVQQKPNFSIATKVEAPQISIDSKSEIPGFTSEPFTQWAPHTNNKNPTDPGYLQENEELFEFSDSVQSPSPRSDSMFGSFNKLKLTGATTSEKQKRDSVSSSSSDISEDKPTLSTINPDHHEASFKKHIRPAVRPDHSFPSDSSESDHVIKPETDKDTRVKVTPKPRRKKHGLYLAASQSKTLDAKEPSPPAGHSSSSSSDSEADPKVDPSKDRVSQIKKHSDIKAPLEDSNSSSSDESSDDILKNKNRQNTNSFSSSDSEDETSHRVQQSPGKLGISTHPFQESQTKSHDPNAKWPTIDLQYIPHIKRRLDIKAPSVSSDTSSSSDSEDGTTKYIKKQEQGAVHVPILPNRSSQKGSHEHEIRRRPIPPERPRSIKRDSDIKEPSSASSSSSSSDSEDETSHKVQHTPGKLGIAIRPFQESQTKSQDPNAKWPAIDLQHFPHIKRRLDIKAPSVGSDTSSSSDSEDGTTKYIKKQERGAVHVPILPNRSSRKGSHEHEIRRPPIPPRHPRSIKRDSDIKEPSSASSSSSSSDSEDETSHKVQHTPGKLGISTRPFQESQTKSHDPDAKWPAIDLQHIPHIKQRLDIKAPSVGSDTSSSSDSEDGTTKYIKRQEQGAMHMPILPNRSSQKVSHEHEIRRPPIPPEHPRSIKRDSDIKEPSSASSSSSSSDSEDETSHKVQQSPGKLGISTHPFQESQTKSHDPNAKWPAIDLQHIPHIKRRLDIKAPSVGSDTSSSSDSEDGTTKYIKKQEQGAVHMPILPNRSSQKASHEHKIRKPPIPPERPSSIKRDSNKKEPSSASSSSTSSDSEDETSHKVQHTPGKLGIATCPFQESQTKSHDPNAKWSPIDLQHIPHIKRRLDIKAPSVGSDTSSSSDSEDGTTKYIKKQERGAVHVPILPNRSSRKGSHEHEIRRPPIPPRHPRSIKRDSDIKEPSSASSSSSSSDSEDETSHKVQHTPGKLGISTCPFQESQTKSHDPNTKWSPIDLQHIPHIKRRLDIKAPSVGSDTSSSSDSEDGTTKYIKKQEQGAVHMPILPNRSSQKVSHEHEIRRPAIPPEHPRSIKRDSDIKEPSSASSSSSSSDSEDETSHKVQQSPGKLGISTRPFQESQTKSHDPNAKWPAIDLQHIPHIKRRLDIKAPSVGSDTSSSSDSEDGTTKYIKKQEQGAVHMPILPNRSSQKVSHEHEIRRPPIPPEHPSSIKRDSNLKEPSSASSSSSSSDSEDETSHKVQHTPGKLGIATRPFQESQTKSHDPDVKWSPIDLQHIPHIKRRLDIKAPSVGSDTSSSDSEDKTTKHIKKQEQGAVYMPILPNRSSQKVSHEHEIRRPPIPPERPSSIKRDSNMKEPSSASSSSSSSDSEDETSHKVQHTPGKLGIATHPFQESQTKSHDPDAKWSPIDLQHIPHIKRRLDIKAPSVGSDTSSSSDSEDGTTKYIKKRDQESLHVPILPNRSSQKTSHEHEIRRPPIPPEHPSSIKRDSNMKEPLSASSSSSSSDSEDETSHKVQQSPGKLGISTRPFQESQTKSHDPDAKWSPIDLQHIPHIKRRLDIKAPSVGSDTSSSSDSEDGTTKYIKKRDQESLHVPILPNRSSQKASHEHEIRRPPIPPERPSSIKRDSNMKEPSSASSSSSSSDSEDETSHKVQQSPGKLGISTRPFQESQTKSHDPDAKWSPIDLQRIPHIKRRLDIKAPSVGSDTSSSSDSEDETSKRIKKQEQGAVHMPILPNRSSQKASHGNEIRKPPISPEGLSSIRRDSNMKEPSSTSSSSSSSDSEDETSHKVQHTPGKLGIAICPFQESQTKSHDPDAKWSPIDLQHIPHIKRRLDIKAPSVGSDTSSSSDSEDETTKHMKKHKQESVHMQRRPTKVTQTKSQYAEAQRPDIHLKHSTDMKAPSSASDSSSSSDSEDEKVGHTEKQKLGSTGFPFQQSQTKSSDPGYTSSSSDEQEEGMEDLINHPAAVKPDSRWPELGLSSTPYVKRRLDIKTHSPKTSSSSDESEGRTTDLPVKGDSKLRSPKSTLFNVPHSTKKDPNIKLEKYVVFTDDLADKPKDNIGTTPDINSELHSRWATMNLGISRFRKRLEITPQRLSKLPSSPPPDSPSSFSAESGTGSITRQKRMVVGMKEIIQTDSSPNLENKPVKVSPTLKDQYEKSTSLVEVKETLRRDYTLFTPEEKSNAETMLAGFTTSHIKSMRVSEKAPATSLQQPPDSSSSSSSSEDEMTENRAPDLSNRRSSSSESEKEATGYTPKLNLHASNMSGMTYIDSPIAYKRSIIKASSLPANSSTSSGKSQMVNVTQESERDRNASLAPKTVSNMSFEDVVRRRIEKSRHNTDVDIPPEIRWTGLGHDLSNLSTPAPRTDMNSTSTSPQQSSPVKPEFSPPYPSSITSDVKIKQDSWKSDVMPTHKFSSPSTNSASSASGGALYRLYNSPNSTYETARAVSEDRRERKGLSALKVMSSERKKWDTGDFNVGASPKVDNHSPQADGSLYYHRSESDIKSLPKKPLTQLHLPSTSLDERTATYSLYGVPLYRSHDIRDTKPPQEAPPPIPATPSPDEAVELTWRSPQGAKKQGLEGNRSYQQQRQNTKESGSSSLASEYPPVYLNTSNITHV